jgi:hypothetical protein
MITFVWSVGKIAEEIHIMVPYNPFTAFISLEKSASQVRSGEF